MGKLKDQLYNRLAEKPHPLFVFQKTLIPAATIWIGVRAWIKKFRELNLESGDRIILSYQESPAFLHILFASIWEGLTLIILKTNSITNESIEFFDAKLVVSSVEYAYSMQPDNMGLPQQSISTRKTKLRKTEAARFILQSSGSTGTAKFICLAEDSIYEEIQTHSKIFQSNDSSALSILPWSHCFGLVLDLLMCTFHSELIVRDPENGKNVETILELFGEYEINHFSSVPIVIERILQRENGLDYLQKIKSGIIGGAPISRMIADKLKSSNFSVGYGQTEASPGICLGEKGIFYENFIGNPLGCETKITEIGELQFKGNNSFLGYWQDGQINIIPQKVWISTGDIVEQKSDGLFFIGRLDYSFKLPTGIMIQPEIVEREFIGKISNLSQCMVYFKNEFYLVFSVNEQSNEQEVMVIIRKNIPSILKNINVNLKSIQAHDWIYSAKGEINRAAMIDKLK